MFHYFSWLPVAFSNLSGKKICLWKNILITTNSKNVLFLKARETVSTIWIPNVELFYGWNVGTQTGNIIQAGSEPHI